MNILKKAQTVFIYQLGAIICSVPDGIDLFDEFMDIFRQGKKREED